MQMLTFSHMAKRLSDIVGGQRLKVEVDDKKENRRKNMSLACWNPTARLEPTLGAVLACITDGRTREQKRGWVAWALRWWKGHQEQRRTLGSWWHQLSQKTATSIQLKHSPARCSSSCVLAYMHCSSPLLLLCLMGNNDKKALHQKRRHKLCVKRGRGKVTRIREIESEKGRCREVGKWEQNKVRKHSGVCLVSQIVGGRVTTIRVVQSSHFSLHTKWRPSYYF